MCVCARRNPRHKNALVVECTRCVKSETDTCEIFHTIDTLQQTFCACAPVRILNVLSRLFWKNVPISKLYYYYGFLCMTKCRMRMVFGHILFQQCKRATTNSSITANPILLLIASFPIYIPLFLVNVLQGQKKGCVCITLEKSD